MPLQIRIDVIYISIIVDKDAVPKQVKLEIQSPTSLLPPPGKNKTFTDYHISKYIDAIVHSCYKIKFYSLIASIEQVLIHKLDYYSFVSTYSQLCLVCHQLIHCPGCGKVVVTLSHSWLQSWQQIKW